MRSAERTGAKRTRPPGFCHVALRRREGNRWRKARTLPILSPDTPCRYRSERPPPSVHIIAVTRRRRCSERAARPPPAPLSAAHPRFRKRRGTTTGRPISSLYMPSPTDLAARPASQPPEFIKSRKERRQQVRPIGTETYCPCTCSFADGPCHEPASQQRRRCRPAGRIARPSSATAPFGMSGAS